jgi:hypothetical protein
MAMHDSLRFPVIAALAALAIAAPPAPASAGPTPAGPVPALAGPAPDRAAVLRDWTQAGADSFRAWNDARLHPERWAAYGFVWSTDYCSGVPERPAGFDFRLPCRRHDFGYRNYRAMGRLPANRARLDRAFMADLVRQCATYRRLLRPVCNVVAVAYYGGTRTFGARATGSPRGR